ALRRRLLFSFALDRGTTELLRRISALRRRLALGALHSFFESLDRATEILPDVAQLLGSKDQHDDQKNDQPMPDAQATHDFLLYISDLGIIRPSGFGPPTMWMCKCITSCRPMRPVLM